jgi:uncharacterized membrane protein
MAQGEAGTDHTGSSRAVLRTLALAWIGLVVGTAVDPRPGGAITGAALGAIVSGWLGARQRLAAMTRTIDALQRRIDALEGGPVTPAERSAGARADVPDAVEAAPADGPAGRRPGAPAPPASAAPRPAAAASVRAASPRGPGPIDHAVARLRALLLGGNTVVRVGVLVLLVGIALLARYAAEHSLFPIEARLAAAALIGLALTAVGYRQRRVRPGFGISLQGGGVAALYLVVFFAFRVYALVPAGLAFALFAAIAVACGVLAVTQRAQPLLVIGSLGGFAAPVLASTGQGSHVFLFGFHLVLNTGIAAVAWFRAWRLPPLIAFLCTYGVATAWGVLRYRPEDFATTEPFVVAFFALFTAVAILHAARDPARLRGTIDGTLVFGTPLLSLLAQARLLSDTELGLAWSAVALGLVYAGLATWLWRAFPPAMHRLAEAFVALAVGFGTMAIPFAFEASLTVAIAWALEGAGLYWVGLRQARRLARFSGIGLQALAAVSFVLGAALNDLDWTPAWPLANGRFLSCLALALAGLFIAWQADARRTRIGALEWWIARALAAWGLLWWALGVLSEIDGFVARPRQAAATVATVGVTAFALETAAGWRAWRFGRLLALTAIPALALLVPAVLDAVPHLLAHGGWLAWPLALGVVYRVVARLEPDGPAWAVQAFAPAFWLVVLVVTTALGGLAASPAGLTDDWAMGAAAFGGSGVMLGALHGLERGRGPFGRHPRLHLGLAMAPVVALGGLAWLALNVAARGDASPLPHVPLMNPVDVALAAMAAAAVAWWAAFRRFDPARVTEARRLSALAVAGVAAFVWLDGVLVRAVHQWTGVRFRAEDLWDSVALQSSLSIAWTLVALGGMLGSTRRGLRRAWMVFASLLGLVVLKLFVVDLSQLSTIAKIGTFLVVGLLLLVVGYLSPVPPGEPAPAASGLDPEMEGRT